MTYRHLKAIIGLLCFFLFYACQHKDPNYETKNVTPQPSNDVQLLQMWTDKSIDLKSTDCDGNDPDVGQTTNKDCSRKAKEFARVTWANVDSPNITPWQLPFNKHQGFISSRFGSGNLVEIRVLLKENVKNSPIFKGVGFYYSNNMGTETVLIPAASLHIVNTEAVFLSNSREPAVVLRFVAYMPHIAGNSSTGWAGDSLSLKPFAEFNDGTNTYQNWENVSDNHRVYRKENSAGRQQVVKIDRQDQLIAK